MKHQYRDCVHCGRDHVASSPSKLDDMILRCMEEQEGLDPIEYALDRATHLMDELVTIKDAVGELDDLYETEYIDNRFLDNLGAYQHITYALRQLQNYAWQIKEERGDA